MNTKSISIIFIILIFLITGFFVFFSNSETLPVKTENLSCVTKTEIYKIKGNSLEPLIKDGTVVEGLLGYYNCNQVKRGDLVVIKFKTREESFIKIIKAVPGDRLEFVDSNLKVNDKILENSEGKPYIFNDRDKKLISIPLKNNIIPQGYYLVLSNEYNIGFDSRQYGLIEKDQLKGKVIL